jgi:hypothetical protein
MFPSVTDSMSKLVPPEHWPLRLGLSPEIVALVLLTGVTKSATRESSSWMSN